MDAFGEARKAERKVLFSGRRMIPAGWGRRGRESLASGPLRAQAGARARGEGVPEDRTRPRLRRFPAGDPSGVSAGRSGTPSSPPKTKRTRSFGVQVSSEN